MHPEEIPGFLLQEEGHALECLAHGCEVVMEIGCYKGRSTAFLARGVRAKRGHVWTVDHFRGSPEHERELDLLEQFERNLGAAGLRAFVSPLQADSLVAGALWGCKHHRPIIDLLFIDGEHSADAVASDFAMWQPHVKPGGLIAFHDYRCGAWPEVTEFVDRVVRPTLKVHDQVLSLIVFENR